MATIKFYLKRPKSDKPTAIYFLMNYGAYTIQSNGNKKYLPLKYYTNETILPEKWDFETGLPIAPTAKNKRTNAIEYKEMKTVLEKVESTAKDVLRRLENDGIQPTNDILTKELDMLLKGYKDVALESNRKDLLSFISSYIDKSEHKPNTLKGYKQTKRELDAFAKLKGKRIFFNDVDLDFYMDFVEFLTDKTYAPNTIGTRIKDLKMFMNESYERGLHTNLDFKKKRFSKPREDTFSIYLTLEELDMIYKKDFSNNKKLEKVRDLFLIGCYTGLRFSDLSRLTSDNIGEDRTITMKTIKTGANVVIPVHSVVLQILSKYNNELPKVPSNQKFNEYIKDVAEASEIKEEILISKTKGSLNYEEPMPKYKLVTSHTARRSFATNAYLSGVPSISIMKITGHKTEAAFMRYIKISAKENAMKLITHKFFNPMSIAK
ncbi:phage integrase SAM-like domain-containing protein [uncultured Bacteroides sp.]|uniref:site-specific integrase n=1 Tax=uncultured Bacteroides sp. TaxID=162156 RepID=UPI002AAB0CAA|nr:phage integrase SAM-like domain-containing protein [uncultured Bacteroides sp.]